MSNTTYSPSSTITTHWLASEALGEIDALCLGTGRFLRSVLVPALVGAGLKPALIQTRGRSFLEYMQTRSGASRGTYPVDTVLSSGEIDTQEIPCWGAFSLGKEDDKRALAETLQEMKGISVLGVGVTEAGLVSKDTPVMKDLYDLLHLCFVLQQDGVWKSSKICVIDMDNVPNNGDKIQTYLKQLASSDEVRMQEFLTKQVVFMNTMVDRITSHRKGHPLIPRCEPTPAKALVVLDAGKNLPPSFSQQPGIVVRATPQELQKDISLKLRIANGTHTAVAHSLALLKHLQTDVLSKHPLFMSYLDLLVQDQIIPAAKTISTEKEAAAVWEDWRQRLVHPHFGLSSFFITQNGPAKGGIRWSPTVTDLCRSNHKVAVTFAFAYAALLRWLTPIPERGVANGNGVYIGWLDGVEPKSLTNIDTASTDVQAYADGLRYDLKQGWYEYKCENNALVEMLQDCIGKQPSACLPAVRAYLVAPTGGNLKSIAADSNVDVLVNTTATLYSRMLAGDGQESLMQELLQDKRFSSPCSTYMDIATENPQRHWLEYRRRVIPDFSRLLKFPVNLESVESVVIAEVAGAVAIDLHTHLLPPTHGYLCAWGIDELLSYVSGLGEENLTFVLLPPTLISLSHSLSFSLSCSIIWLLSTS